jgi:hypothetical protein
MTGDGGGRPQVLPLDLGLPDWPQFEWFSFPDSLERPSSPEVCGLRHLAFEVTDIDEAVRDLQGRGVAVGPARIDEHTGRRFTFSADRDGLPLNSTSSDTGDDLDTNQPRSASDRCRAR